EPGDLSAQRHGVPSARNRQGAFQAAGVPAARLGGLAARRWKNVQRHVLWAGATLALVIGACGGSQSQSAGSSSAGTTSCVNASASHRAYVVVQHQSGQTVQRCVGFNGSTVDAVTLMKESKIEYQAQTTSFGLGVCQIDHEP